MNTKPRVIKDFSKLKKMLKEQIKLAYPYGFEDHLISFSNAEGKKVLALPFETDEKYYLIKMSLIEAQEIIEDYSDYDSGGMLKGDIKDRYEEKYESLDRLTDEPENDEHDDEDMDVDDDDDDR